MKAAALLALAVLTVVFAPVAVNAAPAKPNVIFILADDLGYGDVGVTFQNARDPDKAKFATPNLDALAASGLLLQQHYSGSPVCAPARASLLLGQHQGDCPIRDNQFDKALPSNTTLGTVMKAGGYHTVAIGKWGLQGAPPEFPGHPLRHGFDEFFGFLAHESGHAYYHDPAHPLHEGFQNVTEHYLDVYSTDLFTARAKKFITDHQAQSPDEPFFMYLAYTAPHMPQQIPGGPYPDGQGLHGGLQWPLSPTPKTRDTWYDPQYVDATLPGRPQQPWTDRMKRYATVIRRLDQGVGDVVQLLRDLKIDGNTLVVFTSDNGPSNEGIDPRRFDSWGPFDGFKRDLWEGGVREPTIVSWPGKIAAGTTSPFVSAFWDWMPTFADVAGLAPPAQADGVSLLPSLTGVIGQRSRGFVYEDYFYFSPPDAKGPLVDIYKRKHVTGRGVQQFIREGDFVAIRTQVTHADDPLRLYNVVSDPHEDHNLAGDAQYAGLLKRLTDELPGVRRPSDAATRPYDDQLIPAINVNPTAGTVSADLFAGFWPWVPDFDAITPAAHRTLAGFDVGGLSLSQNSGVRLSGYLRVPTDGNYTFHLSDDGGAHLWIHDAHLIDDDFNHSGAVVSESIALQAGWHPFRLFYRHQQGTPLLKLEYEGPGVSRTAFPPAQLAPNSAATTKPATT